MPKGYQRVRKDVDQMRDRVEPPKREPEIKPPRTDLKTNHYPKEGDPDMNEKLSRELLMIAKEMQTMDMPDNVKIASDGTTKEEYLSKIDNLLDALVASAVELRKALDSADSAGLDSSEKALISQMAERMDAGVLAYLKDVSDMMDDLDEGEGE